MTDKRDEALKLALENICAAKLCEFNSMSSRHEMIRLMDAAITAIREALAEQPAQQEPVAWQHRKPIMDSQGNTRGYSDWLSGKGLEWWPHRALYTYPPAQQEAL